LIKYRIGGKRKIRGVKITKVGKKDQVKEKNLGDSEETKENDTRRGGESSQKKVPVNIWKAKLLKEE